MTLGERIKQIRLLRKMEQEEFAQSIGITRSWLNKIENNKASVSDKIIISVEEVYKVKISVDEKTPTDEGVIKVTDLNKLLARRILKNQAMLEVTLEMLAEWAARDSGRPVTVVLGEINSAVANKLKAISEKGGL